MQTDVCLIWFFIKKERLHTRLDVRKCVVVNRLCDTRVHMCTRTKEHRTKPNLSSRESRAYDTQATRARLGESVGACIVRRDPMVGEALRANGWAERGFASGGARSARTEGRNERAERASIVA